MTAVAVRHLPPNPSVVGRQRKPLYSFPESSGRWQGSAPSRRRQANDQVRPLDQKAKFSKVRRGDFKIGHRQWGLSRPRISGAGSPAPAGTARQRPRRARFLIRLKVVDCTPPALKPGRYGHNVILKPSFGPINNGIFAFSACAGSLDAHGRCPSLPRSDMLRCGFASPPTAERRGGPTTTRRVPDLSAEHLAY